jgi:hypothetical protein
MSACKMDETIKELLFYFCQYNTGNLEQKKYKIKPFM